MLIHPRRHYVNVFQPEEDNVDALNGEEEDDGDGGRGAGRKRRRSEFIDKDDKEVKEEDDEEDVCNVARFGGRRAKRRSVSEFLDLEAAVDSDVEEEQDEGQDDFIVDGGADLPDENDARRMNRRSLLPREDDQEDVEALERSIRARYARSSDTEYDETTDVEQRALLPSVRDTKLWMVRCLTGREREAAVCLMQKYTDKESKLQIRSAIALDHLKNYIYIEADKEAHVREACKGMRSLFSHKVMLVPIKEMTDVLSVESKTVDLSKDTWVRIKTGTYKGDLAKVVDVVDTVRQRITVKLIPRINLQTLTNNLDGREVPKKKAFVPPPRFMNVDEARKMHIRVEHKRDPLTGEYFESINGMRFIEGFLYKVVSMKSISTQNTQPSFDELEKFQRPSKNRVGDIATGLSPLFASRKKGHFMMGDQVIVVKGDLKNLKGRIERLEEDTIHIRPTAIGLKSTVAVYTNAVCKYFEVGPVLVKARKGEFPLKVCLPPTCHSKGTLQYYFQLSI
ncbi:hypothetical protein F0562_031840 [Nyssa sinensis]|uniref:KOW domain-containing protein n=1 Tax=Nyssa sinensis TaxID=561372 RepID=A0A5J5ATR2_9ASTE|nr:hypothetical protein F0562_031840 [Nyssa sinensis]